MEASAKAAPAVGSSTAAAAAAAGGAGSPQPVQPSHADGAVQWDPDTLSATRKPSKACISRLRKELRALYKDPLPGILVFTEPANMTIIHALITGPSSTPYAGGMLAVRVGVPDDYPLSPPRVKLLTTGGGTVRLNPNLYKNGKVCLSILGTWQGPSWSSSQSIGSVLLSVQSLLGEHPATNEPGFNSRTTPQASAAYDAIIAHETLRVAVLDVLQNPEALLPGELAAAVPELAAGFADTYRDTVAAWCHLDGTKFQDPFQHNIGGTNTGTFAFQALGQAIAEEVAKVGGGGAGATSDTDDSDTSSDSDSDA